MSASILDYLMTQTPLFIVSVMGLVVAGLALWFGICVTSYLFRRERYRNRSRIS